MTDAELLDGLQRLIEDKVTVVRTCRSGVKIVVADGSLEFMLANDEDHACVGELRQYFGGGADPHPANHHDEFGTDYGPDLRIAIKRALKGEAAYPVGKWVVK